MIVSGHTVLQVQQAAPEKAGGGQWVLCRYKDLVGREGKEMIDL